MKPKTYKSELLEAYKVCDVSLVQTIEQYAQLPEVETGETEDGNDWTWMCPKCYEWQITKDDESLSGTLQTGNVMQCECGQKVRCL